jgi:hypothetical protein
MPDKPRRYRRSDVQEKGECNATCQLRWFNSRFGRAPDCCACRCAECPFLDWRTKRARKDSMSGQLQRSVAVRGRRQPKHRGHSRKPRDQPKKGQIIDEYPSPEEGQTSQEALKAHGPAAAWLSKGECNATYQLRWFNSRLGRASDCCTCSRCA